MKSLIKDWITDGVGIGLWILTGYLLYNEGIKVWPDAVCLFIVGGVMFYIPDEWVTDRLKKYISKKTK